MENFSATQFTLPQPTCNDDVAADTQHVNMGETMSHFDALEKMRNGELSMELFYAEYMDRDKWRFIHQNLAEIRLRRALRTLGFRFVKRTKRNVIVTEDQTGIPPRELRRMLLSIINLDDVLTIDIRRNHGRIRYVTHLKDDMTILKREVAEYVQAKMPKTIEGDALASMNP